jgi:phosphatidylinositol glycan class V
LTDFLPDRDVGFLRYWTISNSPLFLLATPMLVILSCSSFWAASRKVPNDGRRDSKSGEDSERRSHQQACLTRLAIPQGLLAIMAFTVYHVQIITRISSGYPLWYWYLASQIFRRSSAGDRHAKGAEQPNFIVRLMVLYGLIQGGLFASFLPPA